MNERKNTQKKQQLNKRAGKHPRVYREQERKRNAHTTPDLGAASLIGKGQETSLRVSFLFFFSLFLFHLCTRRVFPSVHASSSVIASSNSSTGLGVALSSSSLPLASASASFDASFEKYSRWASTTGLPMLYA
jgi:hypothetical protein